MRRCMHFPRKRRLSAIPERKGAVIEEAAILVARTHRTRRRRLCGWGLFYFSVPVVYLNGVCQEPLDAHDAAEGKFALRQETPPVGADCLASRRIKRPQVNHAAGSQQRVGEQTAEIFLSSSQRLSPPNLHREAERGLQIRALQSSSKALEAATRHLTASSAKPLVRYLARSRRS